MRSLEHIEHFNRASDDRHRSHLKDLYVRTLRAKYALLRLHTFHICPDSPHALSASSPISAFGVLIRTSQPPEMSRVPREVHKALAEQGLIVRDDNVVIMQKNAPSHPRNWSFARKVYETGVLTAFVTISQVVAFSPTQGSTELTSVASGHFWEMLG